MHNAHHQPMIQLFNQSQQFLNSRKGWLFSWSLDWVSGLETLLFMSLYLVVRVAKQELLKKAEELKDNFKAVENQEDINNK